MGAEDPAVYQLMMKIESLLAGQSGATEEVRRQISAIQTELARQREQMEQSRRLDERIEDHLEEAPTIKANLENRIYNLERLALESAGKIAANENEKHALIKAQKEALETEQRETTKFRRGLIAALIPIGGAILGGLGWMIKHLIEWWDGMKR